MTGSLARLASKPHRPSRQSQMDAPLPIGQSILLSSEVFHALTFTDYGEGRFVRVEVVELEGVKNFVDLKLTFARRVEIGE
jgi:hypothetical protein